MIPRLLLSCIALVALLNPCGVYAKSHLVLIAGTGTKDADAPAVECQLREPFAAEFLPSGELIVVEMAKGNRILKIDAQQRLTVFAGDGVKGFAGDGGPALAARFNGIHNLAIAPSGEIYIADTWNHRVRKIDPATGIISTIAGTGEKKFGGDGEAAIAARFGSVMQIALSPAADAIFVADLDFKRVRRIDLASKTVKTVAGNGQRGVPADGASAVEQPLVDPRAVVPDTKGGFYILERNGNTLRYVDASGVVRTVAGTGKSGQSALDVPALEATFNGPKHLCLDPEGNPVIADAENHVVRKLILSTGRVVQIAGTGKPGLDAPGDALATRLSRPHGVVYDAQKRLIIVDSYNDRVLRLEE